MSKTAAETPTAEYSLFLDFDGVLNGDTFLRRQRNHGGERLTDPDNVGYLDALCRELPVDRIVVTSSWRKERTIAQLRELLAAEGFEHSDLITGMTGPCADTASARSSEIVRYAADANIRNWVAIDDFALELPPTGYFFRTSPSTGLDHRMYRNILKHLDGSP